MRRLHVLWALCALCVALMAAAPAIAVVPAPPYETNAACLDCHDVALSGPTFSKVDFAVPGVDLAKCGDCHWYGPHPNASHFQDRRCDVCHYTWPARVDFFWAQVTTPYGMFDSAASLEASPERLHDIHVNGSWPQQVADRPSIRCASCHAPAACDACHADDVAHGEHTFVEADGAYAYPPVEYTVATGTTLLTEDTAGPGSSTCVNGSCHALAQGSTPQAVVKIEESSPAFAYTGMWSTLSRPEASGGSLRYSATAGSSATIAFEGPGTFRLFGAKRYNTGIATVSLDGGEPAVLDTYSPESSYGALYEQALVGEGAHTLTLTVTGTRNPLSSGVYVFIDVLEVVRDGEPGEFVPPCASCHADKTVTHGYETIDHVGDVGGELHDGKPCASCHAMDVLTEHEKTTSASAGGVCFTCHPSPRDTFEAWDQSCEQGGCHASDGANEPHAAQASAHTPRDEGEAAVCGDCHPGDLGAVHSDAIHSEDASRTSCNVCHTPSDYPPTNDCTSCHFTFEEHYAGEAHFAPGSQECVDCHETADVRVVHETVPGEPWTSCARCHNPGFDIEGRTTACVDCHATFSPVDPSHYPSSAHAVVLVSKGCSQCHSMDLRTEHAKATSGPVGCVQCHETYVDGLGDWDGSCTACHPGLHTDRDPWGGGSRR